MPSWFNLSSKINQPWFKVFEELSSVKFNKTFQGSIRFEYEDMVVIININKFGGGAAQFSAGVSPRRMYCPDPFMSKLSDPNMHQ